jgi:hypothetical protein
MQLYDHVALDKADVRMTNDGYLVCMPRVARTGIQIYGGNEVGMPSMDTVRVYRPPEEVFNKDSMVTFAYRPITDDHPSKPVSASNWKDYAVGQSGGEVARDGEFMRVPMVVMDEKVIKKYKDGKVELSVGYATDLKWEPWKDTGWPTVRRHPNFHPRQPHRYRGCGARWPQAEDRRSNRALRYL